MVEVLETGEVVSEKREGKVFLDRRTSPCVVYIREDLLIGRLGA